MRCKAFRTAHGNRLIDVLALAPVALRRHHHPARDLVGHLAAEFTPDQVQTGVDSRRGTRAGDQVAVVDEQHIAVDLGCRVLAREFVGVHPVRRTGSAVEQSGGARDEGARAHGEDDRTGVGGGPDGGQCLRQILRSTDRRNGDQVGADQVVEAMIRGQGRADGGAKWLTRDRTADLEVEVGHAVAGAVDTEDLADDAELEDRQTVQHERRYALDCHGSILSQSGFTATVG